MSKINEKPNYGFDAPGIIRNFLIAGTALIIISLFIPSFELFGLTIFFLGWLVFILGIVPLTLGLSMTVYGLKGKFNIRDIILGMVEWKGDEQVLDIGTGRGLLLIGAAKRLKDGKATGIDIWNSSDLSGNGKENALKNAGIEKVSDKIEILSADVRQTGFADNSFDVIVSLLCLHNIEGESERRKACQEIARILKPGGKIVIGDYIKTPEYVSAFWEAGLTVENPKSYLRQAYSAMYIFKGLCP